MRSKLMLSFTASAAVMLFHPTTQTVWAQGQAALTGTVSSEAEGNMEGVVVTAKKAGSIVEVSVTTDAQGRYTFPENRLEPGEYTLSIRAVGYDIDAPTKATVGAEKTANGRHQAQEDQESRQPAHQCRVDDEHPRHRRAEGDAAQLRRAVTRWSASCARRTIPTSGRT